ncbi:MAG: PilZ domain-containing protein [Nitrospirae bacterium]|nr:PilZ domain-containing protein [Nitrospirota bacterium]
MSKRSEIRFVRRLETEFSAEGKNYRGISSDLSLNGLFIRTTHPFSPGTRVEILIHLPEGPASKLKGIVRRALKNPTPVSTLKNGMGIELVEKDDVYNNFIQAYAGKCGGKTPKQETGNQRPAAPSDQGNKSASAPPDFVIISCGACGVKNKVRTKRLPEGPKCGRCGALLPTD